MGAVEGRRGDYLLFLYPQTISSRQGVRRNVRTRGGAGSPSLTAQRAILPHLDRFRYVDRRSDRLFNGGRGRGCRDRSDPDYRDPKPSHRTHYCYRRFLRLGVRAPKACGPSRVSHRPTSCDPRKLAHLDPDAPSSPSVRLQPRPLYRHPVRDSLPTPSGAGTAKFPEPHAVRTGEFGKIGRMRSSVRCSQIMFLSLAMDWNTQHLCRPNLLKFYWKLLLKRTMRSLLFLRGQWRRRGGFC